MLTDALLSATHFGMAGHATSGAHRDPSHNPPNQTFSISKSNPPSARQRHAASPLDGIDKYNESLDSDDSGVPIMRT